MTNPDFIMLDELFLTSLKNKDFDICRKLLTDTTSNSGIEGTPVKQSYPSAFLKHYQDIYNNKLKKNKAKATDKILFDLFYLLHKTPEIYNLVADSIIEWHRNRPTEHETNIRILVKNQIVLSLLKHKNKNTNFEAYAFTLFNDYVPIEIFNSYEVIKRRVEVAINSLGRKQKKPVTGSDKDNPDTCNMLDEIEATRNKNNSNNKYSNASKEALYNEFLGEPDKHLKSINADAFLKLKQKTEQDSFTYCNTTCMQLLWFNAAVSYFKQLVTRSDTPGPGPKDDDSNEMCDDDSTEDERVKAYSLMLIPDRYKCLLLNYYSTDNEEERDVVTRNIVSRLRSELRIYNIAYHSFLNELCKETLLESYILKGDVYDKYFENINIVCTIEVDEPSFFVWKLLADKLISKRNSAIHNSDYEVLLQKHHYNNNIGTIMNKFPSFNIENIIENWEIYKNGSNYKVKCFKELSSQDQYIIVLSENRELENKIIISYFFNELNSQITESNIKNTVSKWKNIK